MRRQLKTHQIMRIHSGNVLLPACCTTEPLRRTAFSTAEFDMTEDRFTAVMGRATGSAAVTRARAGSGSALGGDLARAGGRVASTLAGASTGGSTGAFTGRCGEGARGAVLVSGTWDTADTVCVTATGAGVSTCSSSSLSSPSNSVIQNALTARALFRPDLRAGHDHR